MADILFFDPKWYSRVPPSTITLRDNKGVSMRIQVLPGSETLSRTFCFLARHAKQAVEGSGDGLALSADVSGILQLANQLLFSSAQKGNINLCSV